MSVCDIAAAALSINQACQITARLNQLSNSLPGHIDSLDTATTAIDQALGAGPAAVSSLHSTIVGAAQGAQSVIRAYRTLDPILTAAQEIRDARSQLNTIARGLIGVVDSLNCVAGMLTGQTIPALHRARSCMLDASGKIDAELTKATSALAKWDNAVTGAINSRINDLDIRLTNVLRDFNADSQVVACLSSVLDISEESFRLANLAMLDGESNAAILGQQAGGCAGTSAAAADLATHGIEELNAAVLTAMGLNDQTATVVTSLNSLTTPKVISDVIAQSLSTISTPPFPESAQTSAAAAAASMATVSTQATQAAQAASVTQVAFNFGHEIHLDRVNDVIRIRHRDKYTLLFNASNIIAATEVTNKRLVWLENMMTVFNTHIHGTSPPPTPLLQVTDGTTIFKAG